MLLWRSKVCYFHVVRLSLSRQNRTTSVWRPPVTPYQWSSRLCYCLNGLSDYRVGQNNLLQKVEVNFNEKVEDHIHQRINRQLDQKWMTQNWVCSLVPNQNVVKSFVHKSTHSQILKQKLFTGNMEKIGIRDDGKVEVVSWSSRVGVDLS